jgi:hypothetical protein
MSLKYLCIREVLKSLPTDEIEKINSENVDRTKRAAEWFFNQVNEISKISLEGRDWQTVLPKLDDTFIHIYWTDNYVIREHKLHVFMKFNDESVTIFYKVYKCCNHCLSYYRQKCNECVFVQDVVLLSGIIKDNEIDCKILNDTFADWPSKAIQIYGELILKYETIYNGYLYYF